MTDKPQVTIAGFLATIGLVSYMGASIAGQGAPAPTGNVTSAE
jgi:hypothetical protein